MSIYAKGRKEPADHLSSQTHDAACNFEVSQNSGGAAVIVVASLAFLCLFGMTALINGYGILMALLLGWGSTIAIILAGVFAMLLYSVWVDYCKKRQSTWSDRDGHTAWTKNMAFGSANGSKGAK